MKRKRKREGGRGEEEREGEKERRGREGGRVRRRSLWQGTLGRGVSLSNLSLSLVPPSASGVT